MVLKHCDLGTTNKINLKQLNNDMLEILIIFMPPIFPIFPAAFPAMSTPLRCEKKQHQELISDPTITKQQPRRKKGKIIWYKFLGEH